MGNVEILDELIRNPDSWYDIFTKIRTPQEDQKLIVGGLRDISAHCTANNVRPVFTFEDFEIDSKLSAKWDKLFLTPADRGKYEGIERVNNFHALVHDAVGDRLEGAKGGFRGYVHPHPEVNSYVEVMTQLKEVEGLVIKSLGDQVGDKNPQYNGIVFYGEPKIMVEALRVLSSMHGSHILESQNPLSLRVMDGVGLAMTGFGHIDENGKPIEKKSFDQVKRVSLGMTLLELLRNPKMDGESILEEFDFNMENFSGGYRLPGRYHCVGKEYRLV